jgi:hypothetical protein
VQARLVFKISCDGVCALHILMHTNLQKSFETDDAVKAAQIVDKLKVPSRHGICFCVVCLA